MEQRSKSISNCFAPKWCKVQSSPTTLHQNGANLLFIPGSITKRLHSNIDYHNVFDLGEIKSDKVLHYIYAKLETLQHRRDVFALAIQNSLRTIAAGSNGTTSWILGVISDLKLPHPPPIVAVSLGTGNNLAFSFGCVG
ncbi:hypothetical protein DITRI_Ditri20bG0046900 [Diplodiscus trichospermus]